MRSSSRTPFKVDHAKDDRAPLLFIGCGKDHVVPAKVSRKVSRKIALMMALSPIALLPAMALLPVC
jgi:hypothetical protein